MGVRGVKHLLKDVGWIDRSVETEQGPVCDCSGALWKEWNASDAFLGNNNAPPLERIPPDARFLIDGNGLAFRLHSIAYARHLQSLEIRNYGNNGMIHSDVSNSGIHGKKNSCGPTTKSIMADEQATTLALPCMLPLPIIRQVSKEFVAELKQHVQEIKVFWDGPGRRFKADTDRQRQIERQREDSYLELYCNHGTLVTASKRNKLEYAYEWKEVFPYSRLFTMCVRHALLEEGAGMVESIECREEADLELALQASGDSRAYVLGFDSDFYFYKNIQYIPLNQIAIQNSNRQTGLHAFVARRLELSRLLGFGDNDDRLIDLILLMGNDYVDPFLCLETPAEIDLTQVQSMVYYLQCHEDFEATAKSEKMKAPIDFVRRLYNLRDLEAFPLDKNTSLDGPEMTSLTDEAGILPDETMVRDGILRYLQAILTLIGPDEKFHLTEEALHAFELTSTPTGRLTFPGLDIRPNYREMKAAAFIEGCISRFYRMSPNSLLIRSTPPDFLMSRTHFLAALASFRIDTETEDSKEEELVTEEPEPTPEERIQLPIDEHEEAILENIRNHRVTIIHGETGCGKSSRVPVMLLKAPPPDVSLRKVNFFISQPRRIAAKALVERVRSCESELRNKFALRMGHGWKEYETKDTQVHFVTTGYLVRLLANHPERFDACTHLVIDEVHERSVDTDLLCLLCRRLLQSNRAIRLVLMSATLATKMYREYFGVPNEPIHVGVRRYAITEYYVEDLEHFGLPEKEVSAAKSIQTECNTKFCITPPSAHQMKHRYDLAARVSIIVGDPGTSVLIFVPGMGDIIAISEIIETYHKPGIRYTCFPIHSDIPFEEQMDAFNAPEIDEVKIILATNAAESSVTLPNVDHVICLGLCKQIVYNHTSHRQMLTSAWISRASATQRAGRTGRVRPGNVYRLYTKKAFNTNMAEFEPGEMVRIPLDSVILMLKQILNEEVHPIFLDCLEPPALDTIDRSFQSLHYWNFISEASDKGDITPLGCFVSSLGVDLSLGTFIGLGIQFGVAAEAIEMAAMMSLPKSPFVIASPMWMTPAKFNKSASQTYASKCKFDAGLYSEPMGLMNALWDNGSLNATKKYSWTNKNNIMMKRWQQAVSSRNSLRKRVADFLGINVEKLEAKLAPREMPYEKVVILRILKVWVFSDSIIECSPSKLKLSHNGSVSLSIKARSSIDLKESHLHKILQPEKHPFSLVKRNETEQSGVFEEEGQFHFPEFIGGFEHRLLSYASEKNIDAALCYSDGGLYLYLNKTNTSENGLERYLESIAKVSNRQDRFAYDYINKKRRGMQERPSGIWTITDTPSTDASFSRKNEFMRIDMDNSEEFGSMRYSIIQEFLRCDLKSKMTWYFFTIFTSKNSKKKKTSSSQPFSVTTIGECHQVSSTDLQDLLGKKPLSVSTNTKKSDQSVILQQSPAQKQTEIGGFRQPLIEDVPEGARILAMLASSHRKGGRRNKNVLKIPRDSQEIESEETYDFAMKEEEINVAMRWKRLGSDNSVYVDSSVPSTAIHTTNDLFAVAANALELQSGGMRVENLTLLPSNPLFLLLCHLSFGLEVNSPVSWTVNSDVKNRKAKQKIDKSYAWLVVHSKIVCKTNDSEGNQLILNMLPGTDKTPTQPLIWKEEALKVRLEQATIFNQNASSMGEKLVCFPEMIRELCELFDGVDGHNLSSWEAIDEEALTSENLSKWQWEQKSGVYAMKDSTASSAVGRSSDQTEENAPRILDNKSTSPDLVKRSDDTKRSRNSTKNQKIIRQTNTRGFNRTKSIEAQMELPLIYKVHHRFHSFDDQSLAQSKKWFGTTLVEGEELPEFPSTNILALIFQECGKLKATKSQNDKNFNVALNCENWKIKSVQRVGSDGKLQYIAMFVNDSIPTIPISGRGKNKLPKWIKKSRTRPATIVEAKECVPPSLVCPNMVEHKNMGLMFESMEDALKMEAAFWLNHQFCQAGKNWKRHWYAHSMDQMMEMLQKCYNNESTYGIEEKKATND